MNQTNEISTNQELVINEWISWKKMIIQKNMRKKNAKQKSLHKYFGHIGFSGEIGQWNGSKRRKISASLLKIKQRIYRFVG